jgi:hypothetical protein
MDLGGAGWGLQTIVGAALFVAVLAWVVLRNRASRASLDRTERGTRDVYDRAEQVRRDGDDEA